MSSFYEKCITNVAEKYENFQADIMEEDNKFKLTNINFNSESVY
jgi:hypothetical protein